MFSETQAAGHLQQSDSERALSQEDFTVAYAVSRTTEGQYIDAITGEDMSDFADRYSRMKFGDLSAVADLALPTAEAALQNPAFIALLQKAKAEGVQVFLTAPGIYNVPSSSNLLLRAVGNNINAATMHADLPTVLVADMKKLSVPDPRYAQMSVAERENKRTGSIIPEMFAGAYVVFVDDIYISGTVARESRRALLEEGRAKGVHVLLTAHMDQSVVKTTDGSIENELNRHTVDGSLAAILRILKGQHTVVQKTLRDILAERPDTELYEGLDQLPIQTVVNVYQSAMNNEFSRRYPSTAPALDVVERFLRDRNMLNQFGMVIPTI